MLLLIIYVYTILLFCRQRLRSVNLSAETLESRVLLEKAWAKYKHNQHLADIQMIDRIFMSQQKALDELRNESEELYQEAIQVSVNICIYAHE